MSPALFNQFLADVETLFGERVKADLEFAERLWGSLANVEWQRDGVGYGHSFRSAGRQIAELRGEGGDNYGAYYCCVQDGIVDPDVEAAFATLGYRPETDYAKWLP